MSKIIQEIEEELAKAFVKFPEWPTDPLHGIAIIGEEFGEMTKDALQLCYEPHKTSRENLRKETLQTAAMLLRFAASLGVYEFNAGKQHLQSEIP